jgi:hypothetical protein
VQVDLLGEADRLLDRLLGLAAQTENERAVDDDAVVAVLGEAANLTCLGCLSNFVIMAAADEAELKHAGDPSFHGGSAIRVALSARRGHRCRSTSAIRTKCRSSLD